MCAKLASLSLCFVASTGILSIHSCSFFLVEMWDLIWTEGSRVLFTFSYHGPQVETSILLRLKESVFEAGVSHKEAVETSFGSVNLSRESMVVPAAIPSLSLVPRV